MEGRRGRRKGTGLRWNQRSQEDARVLHPAFCARLKKAKVLCNHLPSGSICRLLCLGGEGSAVVLHSINPSVSLSALTACGSRSKP